MPRTSTKPIYKRPRSTFWQLRWTNSSGRTIKLSSGTKDYAEASRLFHLWKDGFGPTIDNIAPKFFECHKVSPATVSNYKNSYERVRPLLGNVPIGKVTVTDIQRFVDERLAQVKVNTVRAELAFLSSLFSFATKLPGGSSTNPVRDFDRESLKRSEPRARRLSEDEERRLIEIISTPYQRLMVQMAIGTGLKKVEILNLRVRNINFAKRQISLIKRTSNIQWTRDVPLTEPLRAALSAHCRTLPADAFVFSRPDGTRYAGVNSWWETALSKARISDFHFQDLRHTFACRYVEHGGWYGDLQEILGYFSSKSVDRYACLTPEGTDPIPRYLAEAREIMGRAVPSGGG